MTMQFMDSFDHYATADLAKKWTSGSGAIGAWGRNGTNGIRLNNQSAVAASKVLSSGHGTLIAGTAYQDNGGNSGDVQIVGFWDGATAQFDVRILSASRTLRVTRNGTTIATGTTVLSANVSYYVELKVTFNTTTGSYELRIAGATELSGSGINTSASGSTTADTLKLNGASAAANGTAQWDDLYLCDNSGTVNNDFLGDLRVQCIFPDGAGGHTQWTPLSGSNYANVNSTTPDDDTTYNSDATVSDRDTYTFGNLSPSTAAIKAVQIMTYARKDDAGTRTIAPVVRLSSTDYDQASLPNLSTSYQYLPQILETSPATTVAWTLSEINGAEFGEKVIA